LSRLNIRVPVMAKMEESLGHKEVPNAEEICGSVE
jgi:hypothetical protein